MIRPGLRRTGPMQPRLRGRSALGGLLVAALVLALAGVATAAQRLLTPDPDGEVLTLLLLGADEGPPRSGDIRRARADAFQLLFVSPDRRDATLVSVPRDSYVTVPGAGRARINECLVGGPQRCLDTVASVFDVRPDGYLLTSMEAFKDAVAAFGGLEVDVEVPLTDGGADITTTGEQNLSGSQALTYARDRLVRPGGTLDRSRAQAELLAIAHREVTRETDLRRVLEAVTILRRHTLTDLSPNELVRYGFESQRLRPDNVERTLAATTPTFAGRAEVLELQPSAYATIDDAAKDGRLG